MKKVELHVLVDVNVYIDALQGQPVVRTLGDLYSLMPLLTEVAAASPDVAHLTDSDHILDLLETKAITILGYTRDEAANLVNLVAEVSRAAQGIWVDRDHGEESSREVSGWLGRRLLGNGKGQIDHEDLQVLGAAQSAIDGADIEEMSLVVTRDGGFHNVIEDLRGHRIHVAHARQAVAALRAATAHR